jgi:HEAT repeat protein
LLLVVAVGCGRAKPPAAAEGGSPALVPLEPVHADFDPTINGSVQPRTALQWQQVLTGTDPKGRELAARALRDLGKDGFPYLLQGMQSKSWEVRLVSLRAASKELVAANPGRTLPILTELAGDSNPQIAQYAVVRLGWLGSRGQSALPVLKRKLAEDDNPQVKEDVVQSIIDIHDSVPSLAGLLRDPNPLLRKRAAIRLLGLGKNGTRIDAAGTALAERAASDDDPEVRSVATSALGVIQKR